jgi:hypothetical protein
MQHRMRNDRVTINGELGFVLKEAELSTWSYLHPELEELEESTENLELFGRALLTVFLAYVDKCS